MQFFKSKASPGFEQGGGKCACIARGMSLYTALPIFARACGCVLVGGSPDKRPEKRQSSRVRATALPPMNGPAAGGEPAAPPEAGDAAQSNDGAGFFGLCRVPSPATEEACPSCRACGRVFPFQTMAPRSLWLRGKRIRGFPTNQRRSVTAVLSPLRRGGQHGCIM